MELPLDPHMALIDLPFGTPRRQVKTFFSGEPQPFRRSSVSREGDYWPDLGVFASYDEADTLEGLKLSAPAGPFLSGKILTVLPLQEAKQLLRRLDDAMEEKGEAAISKRYGIAVWTSAGMHGNVKAGLRFAPGYYD